MISVKFFCVYSAVTMLLSIWYFTATHLESAANELELAPPSIAGSTPLSIIVDLRMRRDLMDVYKSAGYYPYESGDAWRIYIETQRGTYWYECQRRESEEPIQCQLERS